METIHEPKPQILTGLNNTTVEVFAIQKFGESGAAFIASAFDGKIADGLRELDKYIDVTDDEQLAWTIKGLLIIDIIDDPKLKDCVRTAFLKDASRKFE